MLIPKEPVGFKLIQLAGWAGKCFIVPRTELKEIKDRPEAHDPAIYFLFGEADESTNQKLYIGESEDFFKRLITHDDSKDFWNTALVFTGGLDKAKIKYLEYLATKSAHIANRYDLVNGSSPAENSLSEFDLASTKEYFKKIEYILSALSYPVFDTIKQSITTHHSTYLLKGEGFDAKSQLLDDGSLNVFKGALARIRETDSFTGWSLAARRKFFKDGTLKNNGDGISYILTKDVLFKSPSSAASTFSGRAMNGWTAWRDEKGNTLDENLRK